MRTAGKNRNWPKCVKTDERNLHIFDFVHSNMCLLLTLQERFEINFKSRARKIQLKLGDDFWVENADLANAATSKSHFRTPALEVCTI